jgi:1-acyl-sn-glycerol-3-phosphate acyltransferase
MKEKMTGYKIFRAILKPIYLFWYNPKIIGKENIPKEGSIVVAGNHIHIMDQCNVIISTKRCLHYMAKKEYFDGKFAWFFKIGGCI